MQKRYSISSFGFLINLAVSKSILHQKIWLGEIDNSEEITTVENTEKKMAAEKGEEAVMVKKTEHIITKSKKIILVTIQYTIKKYCNYEQNCSAYYLNYIDNIGENI